MLPTSFWGRKGLRFMMLCQVQAFPKSGAGDCDGEGCVSGLCLVPVAIGFASARGSLGRLSTGKGSLPCGDTFPNLSLHWALL